ncbi:MAG TPA: alpha-ketoglutarate-dependent dioxygenase AlkB [Gemmatimonadales bacterium]|nr:alpha-ketoglutarate-dependent dioxygenase AlkB [Gemmatimonadales bacterium]
MARNKQLSLLDPGPTLPEGFRYQPDVITAADEQELLEYIRRLPLKEFEFQGFVGKRRTVSFGWRYDFNERALRTADPIPPFLLPLRQAAAGFAGLEPDQLQQALVIEYDAGASIGWHRDKAVFGDVVGVSLLSPCRFRFRRKTGSSWERASLNAEPRSAYLLRGPSRTEWEHSIPAVDALRYSVTFRNLRQNTDLTA